MTTTIGMQDKESASASPSTAELTILFGSQTGNAEYLANQIHSKAVKAGSDVSLASLESWLHSGQPRLRRLLIVTSTHDNGHMPDNAAEFWDWLNTLGIGSLDALPYAVLSIGDSMYEDFCKAGHDIDQRLEVLGAVRVVDGVDCDIDFEFSAGKWADTAVEKLLSTSPWGGGTPTSSVVFPEGTSPGPGGDRKSIARIVSSDSLSQPGSAKQVSHYELEVDGGAFDYEPGDSISVFVTNLDELVDDWITVFGERPVVRSSGEERLLSEVLKNDVELRVPHPGLLVALYRLRPQSTKIASVVELVQAGDRERLDAWLWGRDVLDVLTDLGCLDLSIDDLVAELRPLQHRDYSISSSPARDDRRVHITVGGVLYMGTRGPHRGAATDFLAQRALDGAPFAVRHLPAHNFRLPADDVPVIMIGPGVGVAPFRAFLRQRDARGATGRNWLFFGDQHRAFDWLYEAEFVEFVNRGVLTRLDVAFSRDQSIKHYVQDEMVAHAAEFRKWVSDGAHIFVCGDKTRMASDVDRALTVILAGKNGPEQGALRLAELKSSERYVKDVY